jgi:hypothetical protein
MLSEKDVSYTSTVPLLFGVDINKWAYMRDAICDMYVTK